LIIAAVSAQFFKVLRGVSPSLRNDGKAVHKVDLSIHLPGHEGFGHTPNTFNGNNSIRPKDKSTLKGIVQ
jgi:hypothetical protein